MSDPSTDDVTGNNSLFYALAHFPGSLQLPPSFQRDAGPGRLALEVAYAIDPYSAYSRARVLALSFSTITIGTVEDSRLLDVGWCKVSVQSSISQGAVNCMLEEQSIKVPGQRFVSSPYVHGICCS